MKRLILMRHAKSDWSAGASSDHDRLLNPRGRQGAKALGDLLRSHDLVPDQVLCSTAVRTRETLAGLKLSKGIQVEFLRALYLAAHDEMLNVLRAAQGNVVLMLGHNPGIGIAADQLVDAAPDHPRFDDYPTGATLVADFHIADWQDAGWGAGRVVDFFTPHDLPGKA